MKVLIDNDSIINILPMITIDRLPADKLLIKLRPIVMKAFNGAKNKMVNNIDIELEIGPHVFNVAF